MYNAMKHNYKASRLILSLSLSILLGLNACDLNQNSSTMKTPPVQQAVEAGDSLPLPLTDNCTVISNVNRIEKSDVLDYLTAFWNDANCVKFAEGVGFSGVYVNVDRVQLPQALVPFQGYTSFFCVDKNNNPYVALKFDEVCPGSIAPHVAIKPGDNFLKGEFKWSIVPSNSRSRNNIENFLKTIKIPMDAITRLPVEADPADVISDNFKYKSLIWNDGTYAKYGFSFVHKEQMENWLLLNNQGTQIAGFMCFLGLSGTAENEKVRQVFVPVSRTGILLMDSPFYCLEKSWPPIIPPSNIGTNSPAAE
jgi:hypothetical protein